MECEIKCDECSINNEQRDNFRLISNFISISLQSSESRNSEVVGLLKGLTCLINQYETSKDVVMSALGYLMFDQAKSMCNVLAEKYNCPTAIKFLESFNESNAKG